MRLPLFGRRSNDEPVRIPLARTVQTGFGVYARTQAATPAAEALRAIALTWIEAHAAEPLRSTLLGYTDSVLKITVGDRDLVPLPDKIVLQFAGLGDAEERHLDEATHVVVVEASEPNTLPRPGLWSGLAAARAIAIALDGLVFDPLTLRLLNHPVEFYHDCLPGDGKILVPRHVAVVTSVGQGGLGWMTTGGMRKFGLPELQVEHVPPNLTGMLAHVVNALCHVLGTQAMARGGDEQGTRALEIGPEMSIAVDDIARALDEQPWVPPDGVAGSSIVRLEYTGRPHRGGPFINVVSPRGFKGDRGLWLYSVLSDLLGDKDTMLEVKDDSTAMDDAHRRAVAELPAVKRRFQEGLRPGETLFVKHGFATDSGSIEYMWVAVNTWAGDRIAGQLANEPADRKDLRAGQVIRLRDGEVFDWLVTLPDGTTEGGYTSAVVEAEGRASE